MTTFTQGVEHNEFLISEANGKQSREVVTVLIASAAKYQSGTVLGKVTASGKYVKYSNAASDGSETAVCVLMTPLMDGVNGDQKAVVLMRNAEVAGSMLNNGAGLDTAGVADLLARGILVR